MRNASTLVATLAITALVLPLRSETPTKGWHGYAHDPQHSGISPVESQSLTRIHWKTPVDRNVNPNSLDDLYVHYGCPLITDHNTVLVTVRTDAGEFTVEAHRGVDGLKLWDFPTDYLLPGHNWIPPCSPVLTPGQKLYIPGAGGTLFTRDAPDATNGKTDQIAFFGMANYKANRDAFNKAVFINTPITSDASGNLYFGFQVKPDIELPVELKSGLARISPSGAGTWIAADTLAADATASRLPLNCAPALSQDQKTLYVAVSGGQLAGGWLVALDSATLKPKTRARLSDPKSGSPAVLSEDGTASPTVGPDGDLYYGVVENPFMSNHHRGWLLHYDASLTQQKTPGAFGWDDTASVVPSELVASYHGASKYLLLCKYNNYAGLGGTGINRIVVLDPNASDTDPITGAAAMKEVLSATCPTPDRHFAGHAVREWCINAAAIDPKTKSAIANCEDGKLYRWNLSENRLTESIQLARGITQAYTPTLIGPDGTVYAISSGTLFAVGK